jgi:DNA-binding beta-propeller fold protein YncE
MWIQSTPIDTATNEPDPTLVVSGHAYGLGLTPDGRTLWVSPGNGDTGTTVKVGRSGFDVALDWNGSTAYVTTADGNTLVPVDTGTGSTGAAYTTGAYPLAVAFTPVPVN